MDEVAQEVDPTTRIGKLFKDSSIEFFSQRYTSFDRASDGSHVDENPDTVDENPYTNRNGEVSTGESENSSELTASDDGTSWISWYINLRGNNSFARLVAK